MPSHSFLEFDQKGAGLLRHKNSKGTLFTKILSYKYFWLSALGITLVDQGCKLFTIWHVPLFEKIPIIKGFFYWTHTQNSGAALGMFQGKSFWLAGLAILVLLGFYCCRHHLQLKSILPQYAWGLMSGGILGNMIDRLAYGHVVDFLDFYFGSFHWPTFNIADAAISVGAALFFYHQRPVRQI
jgi:signal peptidase II